MCCPVVLWTAAVFVRKLSDGKTRNQCPPDTSRTRPDTSFFVGHHTSIMMASLGPSTSWQYLCMSSTLCGASKNVTSAPILLNSRHLSRASSSPRPARASVRATTIISAPSSLKWARGGVGGGGEGGADGMCSSQTYRWWRCRVCAAVKREVGDDTSAARLLGSFDAEKKPRRHVLRGQRIRSPSA